MPNVLIKKPDNVRAEGNTSFKILGLVCDDSEIVERLEGLYKAKAYVTRIFRDILILYFKDSKKDVYQYLPNTILENMVVNGDVIFIGSRENSFLPTERKVGLTDEQIQFILHQYTTNFYKRKGIETISHSRREYTK